jgi:2-polyprenyl-3-methyl-5-hydroxy-6-metoxy-1,4-benzoquinol methylase
MIKKILDKIKVNTAKLLEHKARIKIDRLQPGNGPETDRYSYQKKLINFNISKTDTVLDIGSGGTPFPLATHLADLYIGDTSHRSEKMVTDHRPLFICDIEKMPFTDKQFDFVYCSHVLEHVEHPALSCKELMRIGKRGYIETPTKTTDIMFNFLKIKNHHKWHIEYMGNTLVFMEWKDEERIDLGTSYFFEQYHSIWSNEFQNIIANNRKLFVNMMLWENSFGYIVIDKHGRVTDNNANS